MLFFTIDNFIVMGMAGFGLLDSNGKKIEPKLEFETQKNIVVSRFIS